MLAREGVIPATDADLVEVERRLSTHLHYSFDRSVMERVLERLRRAEAARPPAVIPELMPAERFSASWKRHWSDGWNACIAAMTGGAKS